MPTTTSNRLRLVALTAFWSLAIAGDTNAEPTKTVRHNGPPANRVDIAILGEGYTAAEMATFAEDAERVLTMMFQEQPFRAYSRYFNVHRVDVISAESGADHPMSGIFKETALGSFYDCAGITRLICIDQGRVNDILQASLPPDRRDVVLVLVNDLEYGGSGGSIAVASLHSDVIELVLHELGHTFGLLADEYEYGPPECWTSDEPAAVNVTLTTNRSEIKWERWIAAGTAIPTFTSDGGLVGLFEGAEYCWAGKFRPTYDSKMRSLFRPFESVNVEQLTKQIYAFVSPIDSAGHGERRGQILRFYVRTPTPSSHTLQIRWELDGKFVSNQAELRLTPGQLRRGQHELRVTVSDPTTSVRQDPEGLLKETRSWRLGRRTPHPPVR